MSLAWATEFYYHITVSSGIFSHLPFTLAWKLLDESSVRRQTWNGAENSRSRFQGLRQFCGPLGELGKQVRTGTLPLAGSRPLAQMAHGLRVEYGQWGLPLLYQWKEGESSPLPWCAGSQMLALLACRACKGYQGICKSHVLNNCLKCYLVLPPSEI